MYAYIKIMLTTTGMQVFSVVNSGQNYLHCFICSNFFAMSILNSFVQCDIMCTVVVIPRLILNRMSTWYYSVYEIVEICMY